MLRLLRIRNLAVIESAEVEFGPGFTVLTGETGAGKSMLVEAVGLLLGARASADLVRTGESLATIEALFEDGHGEEVVVRREITSQGRSRSFLNGALAPAGALRELSGRLIELHGQHEHQSLLDAETHLGLLDEYAGLADDVATVAQAWQHVSALREQLERASMDVRERAARLELIAFQLGEIERVSPRAGEDEELAAARQVLASAERVQRLCTESYAALYESDGSVLSALAAVRRRIGELASISSEFAPYVTVADDVNSQLEDLAWFVRDFGNRVDASPERLQEVEDRLVALERLKRKHGLTMEQVIERREALVRERDLLVVAGEQSGEIQTALDAAMVLYAERARALSRARRTAAVRFATELERLLAELAMEQARVTIRFNEDELLPAAWTSRGIDVAELFLSPNPGEDLRALTRIVSGGELSRVMLALKTLGARRAATAGARGDAAARTLIFDEVDAGIGGQVAHVVGSRLQDLGSEFQVLCITHLPQIASRAATHVKISKRVRGGRTVTSVEPLGREQRIDELARMIGGDRHSASVLDSARELIEFGLAPPRSPGRKAKGESESRARGESPRRTPKR